MSTDDPAPDRAEIERRLAAVARQAAGQGLEALVVLEPANVYYLSGFRTTLHTRFTAVALRTIAPEQAMLIAPSVDRRFAREPIWYPLLLAHTEIYMEGIGCDIVRGTVEGYELLTPLDRGLQIVPVREEVS